MQRELEPRVVFSIAYHPQKDGQTERTIQTVEDMLRACVLEFGGNRDKCHTPLYWCKEEQKILGGPEMIQDTTDRIQIVRERMKTTQDQ